MTYFIVFLLIVLSGLFSGLNLGLMGLNTQELKRKAKLGNKEAEKVYELRKTGNFLLVTLLLGNVAVNAIIAILLGSVTSGLLAAIISTTFITIFGEIIPQATFTRYALHLGAKLTWLVKIFMYGLYPLTKPTAWILDKVLGQELNTIYSKGELIEIIKEHRRSKDSTVKQEEEKIIKGALLFSEKKAKDIMTPEPMIISFDVSEKITESLIEKMLDSGLSRFPIQENDVFVGLLHTTEAFRKKNRGKTIKSLVSKDIIFVTRDEDLVSIFNKLLKAHHPLAIVVNKFQTVLGLVTLEDLIEEIIQDEIVDEDDTYIDMRKKIKA